MQKRVTDSLPGASCLPRSTMSQDNLTAGSAFSAGTDRAGGSTGWVSNGSFLPEARRPPKSQGGRWVQGEGTRGNVGDPSFRLSVRVHN